MRLKPGTAALMRIQEGLCAYCCEPFEGRGSKCPKSPSLDHVWPRCYGRSKVGNVLAVHYRCNHEKGSRKPNGCQQIMLDAVNQKRGLGCAGMPPGSPDFGPERGEGYEYSITPSAVALRSSAIAMAPDRAANEDLPGPQHIAQQHPRGNEP